MFFLGHFLHLTHQQEIAEADRRHGDFSMIVDADDKETAVRRFQERLTIMRRTRDFFGGQCSIFLVKLLEFDTFPREHAVMLNFKSQAGDPVMPFIDCLLPSDEGDFCRIYLWEENRLEIDGESPPPFLSFDAESEESWPSSKS